MKKLIGLLGVATFITVGCIKKADSITPSHISSTKYEKFSCKQLKNEVINLNETLAVVSAQQDVSAQKNVTGHFLAAMGIFIYDIGVDQEDTVAKLKGEHQALKEAATKKNCSFAKDMRDIK